MPIIRTFAPFVAGVGEMSYKKFSVYNIVGAVVWVVSFVLLGLLFGNQPIIKKNFTLVIAGIIVVSALPAIYELIRSRKEL
jgi:membrane-associated protein